ncbi:MAG: hypothetical protein IIB55_06625 [Planctomycetes bacterium]|nr:hypothetical protein [Planctomycetota bacterium]
MTLRPLASLVVLSLAATALASAQEPQPPADDEPEFASADELLDALETADADLSFLTAQIRYTKTSQFLGEREVWLGDMQFVRQLLESVPTRRMFGVRFDKLYIGNMADDEVKIYIFDGHWFVEKLPGEKLIIKREVVRPGEMADPLRIGEGPFPIPIGQKKADILERFEAELLEPDDGLTLDPDQEHPPEDLNAARNLVNFTRGSYQLRLTPRAEWADAIDLQEIRLWYTRSEDGRLLPRMARTVDFDGDISVIQLINVTVNDKDSIDPTLMSTDVPEGWNAQIREWDGP